VKNNSIILDIDTAIKRHQNAFVLKMFCSETNYTHGTKCRPILHLVAITSIAVNRQCMDINFLLVIFVKQAYECTMDNELAVADAAAYVPGGGCVHSPFCSNFMADILKVRRCIKHLTPSIDAYLLEERSCQISS